MNDEEQTELPDPQLEHSFRENVENQKRKLHGKGITRPNRQSHKERARARKHQRDARKVTRARAK